LSARDFFPVYDSLQFDLSFPQSMRPFLVTLRKDVESPFIAKPKPVVEAAAKKSKKEDKEGKEGKDGKEEEFKKIRIDFEGIENRLVGFPVSEGRYTGLTASRKRVFFTKVPVKGIRPDFNWMNADEEPGVLFAYDLDDNRVASFQKEVSNIRMAGDYQTLFYKSKKRIRAINAGAALPAEGAEPPAVPDKAGRQTGWVDLKRVQVLVQPREEWRQMYEEAWRLQSEHFWDATMSDVDWNLVHDRYASLLPRIRTRSELSDIIWEMQGELGTSHAYEMGGDYRRSPAYQRGFLGADLSWDGKGGGYKIDRIIRGDSWEAEVDSPLAGPGLAVEEGDVIVAVGGRGVTKECSVDELLINSAGKTVSLTIAHKNKKRNIQVKTLKSEKLLRYRNWVETNRKLVHEKSHGKLGYLHIPDMGPVGYAEFHRGFLSEYYRKGMIIDVRYNRGGHVSPLLLQKLLRKRVGYNVSRWGPPEPYPNESIAGPMVALTNQFAGSDGDIFSHCFKMYKLGPLVGKRTWGGVIGIWPRHNLVDGTVTTQPEFSFWFADVGWKVENYGTDPDYDVDIAPHHYRDGKDPQMEKGLELALKALKDNPVELPDFTVRPSLALPSKN
jgi:tricorn protease